MELSLVVRRQVTARLVGGYRKEIATRPYVY